jgi:hypothetical protein
MAWAPRPEMGSGGPICARVGQALLRPGFLVMEETTWRDPGRRLCGQPTAARRLKLHGPIWARPGLTGLGVLPLLCPISDCLSAVEVDSSGVAVRLLFLVPTVSCISVVQVIG